MLRDHERGPAIAKKEIRRAAVALREREVVHVNAIECLAPLHESGGAYANAKKEEEGKGCQALAFANVAVGPRTWQWVREREDLAGVFFANAIGYSRTRRRTSWQGQHSQSRGCFRIREKEGLG